MPSVFGLVVSYIRMNYLMNSMTSKVKMDQGSKHVTTSFLKVFSSLARTRSEKNSSNPSAHYPTNF